jgi:hypothetical protein
MDGLRSVVCTPWLLMDDASRSINLQMALHEQKLAQHLWCTNSLRHPILDLQQLSKVPAQTKMG